MENTDETGDETTFLSIGDEVEIMLTGQIGRHQARVTAIVNDEPRLRLLREGGKHFDESWPVLKHGDYIVMKKLEQK